MIKIKWWILLPLLVFAGLLVFSLTRQTDPRNAFIIPDHILICLDPGHGGDDPGAVFGDQREKDDNLRMALAVRDKLESYGFENLTVMLTREDDTELELQQRVDIANDANATLFISIHRNSGGGQGIETWTSAEALQPETRLATYIQKGLAAIPMVKDRGVKSGTASNPLASYFVVGNTEMPACLVELGFLDNVEDLLLFEAAFDDYAAAIADGILQMVELK